MLTRDQIRTVTFDCYGTLVDSAGGSAAFLYDYALRMGDPQLEPGSHYRDRVEAIQFEMIQGPYETYTNTLKGALARYAAERGYAPDPTLGEAYVRSMGSWQPFPETRQALRAAKAAGLRLAIISNTDRDIIAHTLRQIDVPFDDVITAEDCRAYKPNLSVFEQALSRLGDPPEQILHVAFGYKYDIGSAQQVGMHTAWVNRRGERVPGVAKPDFTWRDLWGLLAFAGGEIPVP